MYLSLVIGRVLDHGSSAYAAYVKNVTAKSGADIGNNENINVGPSFEWFFLDKSRILHLLFFLQLNL